MLEPNDLASEGLGDYDVIVLHFMDWEVPDPGAAARANLKRVIASGKGLVLVHFACGAFQDWPEFVEVDRKQVRGGGRTSSGFIRIVWGRALSSGSLKCSFPNDRRLPPGPLDGRSNEPASLV